VRRKCVYGQNGGYGWWRFAIGELIVTKWEVRLWSKVGVGLGRYFWDLNVLVYINNNRFRCVSNFWFFSGYFFSICFLMFQEQCLKYKFACLKDVRMIFQKKWKNCENILCMWNLNLYVWKKFMCEKFVWNFCEKFYWKNSTSFSKVDFILAWILWNDLQISNLNIFCRFKIIDFVLFIIANYVNLAPYPQLVGNG